ncbi:PelA/Pel-15E family pectate lyase [Mucilaginibacter yixingensis]|uniref:PelA/Pel-15E family pectate lyase n=1 Tax=Mucilaginibacter yixingensis TaxID=1295612 RepID=A0A2T5JFI3_9SPHI|nr:pectate lyase [Mucilaginibacter yixingensis]PTR01106.1 PelA/Pel-15E family pectate lyase [Mucilaginibacter yixingensis]
MNPLKNIVRAALGISACFCVAQACAQDLQADNMLLFQRASGGWSKQYHGKAFSYNVQFSDSLKKDIAIEASHDDANIDNESTKKEIRYLAHAYKTYHNPKYKEAIERGIKFLLKSQYDNGGFPQYYPEKLLYRAEITYNDNAMINALNVLQDVVRKQNDLDFIDPSLTAPCAKAVKKGVQCILNTQIKANGKLTAWCQQYDEKTLQPAKARAYELPSISGSETVGIIDFLMSQQDPSNEIKTAVTAAVNWLKEVEIKGYKFVAVPAPGTPFGTNRQLVADSNAPTIWARYYEIGTNKPFFCDRDGIKKYDVNDIGYERRNGYAWYGSWANGLIDKGYPAWAKKWGVKE